MLVPITITQGDSVRIVIPVTRNGQPVNMATASNVKVSVEDGYGNRKAQYAFVPETGYGSVNIPMAGEYFLELKIERAESKIFPIGPLYFSIVVEFPDPDMPSGRRYETFRYHGLNVRKGSALDVF